MFEWHGGFEAAHVCVAPLLQVAITVQFDAKQPGGSGGVNLSEEGREHLATGLGRVRRCGGSGVLWCGCSHSVLDHQIIAKAPTPQQACKSVGPVAAASGRRLRAATALTAAQWSAGGDEVGHATRVRGLWSDDCC